MEAIAAERAIDLFPGKLSRLCVIQLVNDADPDDYDLMVADDAGIPDNDDTMFDEAGIPDNHSEDPKDNHWKSLKSSISHVPRREKALPRQVLLF